MALEPTLLNTATRQALIVRVRALSPDAQRHWGKMDVTQMVWHVSEALRAALGDIEAPNRSNWFFRRVIRPVAFYAPFPWPKNGPTLPEFDAVRVAPRVDAAHHAQLEALVTLVERCASTPMEGRPHVAFGPLTHAEWQHWGWRHTDHHLRQFGS